MPQSDVKRFSRHLNNAAIRYLVKFESHVFAHSDAEDHKVDTFFTYLQ